MPTSRFEPDPEELVDPDRSRGAGGLPEGWSLGVPRVPHDVDRLTWLLRQHEQEGRGWPGAERDDVLLEVSDRGSRTRQNVVVRDDTGSVRAWGSVHDRAAGRMLLVHVVDRGLDEALGRACSDVLVEWAVGQAREVGQARGLAVQQVDTGAFADDARQHRWLRAAGFTQVRSWWQMTRPVTPDEARLVPSPGHWHDRGVTFRLAEGEADLRAVHEVLEAAFTDHFNSKPETFEEFLRRLGEDPGHSWDHWWLAELEDGRPVGALVGTATGRGNATGSYVAYIGVVEAARGRGVAKNLLRTIIADAASRGRDRVGLEVDADSQTGAHHLYQSMGWTTAYVTQSWHRDVPVGD